MRREEHRWFSGNLGHDMELVVYGHGGQPLICFPSQDGRSATGKASAWSTAWRDLIEAGRLIMIAVDGIDWQSWTNKDAPVRAIGAAPQRLLPLHHRRGRAVRSRRETGRDDACLGDRLQHGRVPRRQLLLPPAGPVRRRDRHVGLYQPRAVRRRVQRRRRLLQQPALLPARLRRPVAPRALPAQPDRVLRRPGRVGGGGASPTRARSRRCCTRRASRPRSTTGATTWSITGTGGRRCCATTSGGCWSGREGLSREALSKEALSRYSPMTAQRKPIMMKKPLNSAISPMPP